MKTRALLFAGMLLSGCSWLSGSEYDRIHKSVTTLEYELVRMGDKEERQLRQKQVTHYNQAGKVVEERDYAGANLDMAGGLVFKYDDTGKLREEALLDGHGNAYATGHYSYQGDTALVREVGESGNRLKKKRRFDGKGRLVADISLYHDGRVMNTDLLTYDQQGNLVEVAGTLDGKPKPRIIYTYDERGNPVERRSVNEQGLVLTQEHYAYKTFDEKGNWTMRSSSDQANVRRIAERVTQYQ